MAGVLSRRVEYSTIGARPCFVGIDVAVRHSQPTDTPVTYVLRRWVRALENPRVLDRIGRIGGLVRHRDRSGAGLRRAHLATGAHPHARAGAESATDDVPEANRPRPGSVPVRRRRFRSRARAAGDAANLLRASNVVEAPLPRIRCGARSRPPTPRRSGSLGRCV
jgi:hypothetical protein